MKTNKRNRPIRVSAKETIQHLREDKEKLEAENKSLQHRLETLDKPALGYVGCATETLSRAPREPLVLVLSVEEQNSKILLAAFHTFKRCIEKLKSKNKDYAQSSDEFSNFHDTELTEGLAKSNYFIDTTRLSIRTLIKTKMKRFLNISSSMHQYIGPNESLADTREDLVNYLVIDKAWEDRY